MPQLFRFEVNADSAGQRLDEFLAARLGSLSRMRIVVLADRGACAVNGVACPPGHKLAAGDHIELADEEDKPTAMTPEKIPLEILHEDDQLLVVVKPAGLLVHPTHSDMTGTLANALAYHLNRLRIDEADGAKGGRGEGAMSNDASSFSLSLRPPISPSQVIRPGIVHRLDRATSGLLVVAKTQRALSVLSQHFQRRLVEKRYLARLRGLVAEDVLHINAPIGRDPAQRPEWNVMPEGKPSETRLRVLERSAGETFVELEPVTGRTNQLRIHCAHIGHVIAGDQWYGADDDANRLCLHAARLAFFHPSGRGWMEFTSPAPFELRNK